ncbi:hydantoinase/oxoprolinase family protein [Ramlibacter sp. G-1-2-2]|uniref:Hydantoinase/oxoprolinase family protein n=1 Tax=Ramlibacter agri TaxID=2728837 RepID=A0A848H6D9_9BURK|nr:hydantoinase/oxoprolinase family protein [Ramlibacter agri]NML46124.1 hydantoinase/oxoprolinase family protein [Ramlibacter agri]
MSNPSIRLAADIGGTFTDVVLETPRRRHSCKVLTTPREPEVAVMQGIARLLTESGVAASEVSLFIHGTTLATNALIERKGARTALLTTEGLRDVLAMGYEKRFDAYDLDIEGAPELVPRPWRFTVRERIAADGSVLLPLDEEGVRRAGIAMREAGVEAVAIGFIHAWAHPEHEKRAREILQPLLGDAVTICLSSEVCPEIREYERFSTTVANAYVRPLMGSYLVRLQQRAQEEGLACPLLLMMSGGGLTTLDQAARFPIRLVESGPAGGAILAAHLARECGLDKVLAFDMGGTTAKICLINDSEPERSRRFEVGRAWKNLKGSGLPVRIPVIELVEIGAGGGSLGRVDALRRITVGPDSCGSEPGPACYGRGGMQPAVTDANLMLGRIDPSRFAAGRMPLDPFRAEAALQAHIGDKLEMNGFWAAVGMSEVVEENMANAARVHAIERGQDLEGFTMIAFGGAAPLHAGRLAQKLGIKRVLVPSGAGVGSAIGFLRAPVSFEVVRSELMVLGSAEPMCVEDKLCAMEVEAMAVVEPARGDAEVEVTRLAELRYAGQGHELRVRLPAGVVTLASLAALGEAFEQAYEQVYGLRVPGSEVEIVTWSVTVSTPAAAVATASLAPVKATRPPENTREAWEPAAGERRAFGQHWRFDVLGTARMDGPALVVEHETTVVLPAGWKAQVDSHGHLRMEVAS